MTPEEHDSIMDELVRLYRRWADEEAHGPDRELPNEVSQ